MNIMWFTEAQLREFLRVVEEKKTKEEADGISGDVHLIIEQRDDEPLLVRAVSEHEVTIVPSPARTLVDTKLTTFTVAPPVIERLTMITIVSCPDCGHNQITDNELNIIDKGLLHVCRIDGKQVARQGTVAVKI